MTPLTSSRGRKRPRREEEETPPRPTLDDLEHEDQAQWTPGRAIWNQPQDAGPSRSTYLGHPHADKQQDRATPEQTAAAVRADGARSQEATASRGQASLSRSATKRQGQSSITDFLSGAGPSAHAGIPDQQQEASEAPSAGEIPQLTGAIAGVSDFSLGNSIQGYTGHGFLGLSTEESLWCVAERLVGEHHRVQAYWPELQRRFV